jgi:hypothetical protein
MTPCFTGNKGWVPHSSPVFGLEWDKQNSTLLMKRGKPGRGSAGIPLKPKHRLDPDFLSRGAREVRVCVFH